MARGGVNEKVLAARDRKSGKKEEQEKAASKAAEDKYWCVRAR